MQVQVAGGGRKEFLGGGFPHAFIFTKFDMDYTTAGMSPEFLLHALHEQFS